MIYDKYDTVALFPLNELFITWPYTQLKDPTSFLKRSNLKMSGARFFALSHLSFSAGRRWWSKRRRARSQSRRHKWLNFAITILSRSEWNKEGRMEMNDQAREGGREKRRETDSNGQSTKIDLLRYLWPICLNRVQPEPGCIATATGPSGQQPHRSHNPQQ